MKLNRQFRSTNRSGGLSKNSDVRPDVPIPFCGKLNPHGVLAEIAARRKTVHTCPVCGCKFTGDICPVCGTEYGSW